MPVTSLRNENSTRATGLNALTARSSRALLRPIRMLLAASFALSAAHAVHGQTIPTISCSTDPNIFNTGYNPTTGGVYPTQIPWYENAYWQATYSTFLGSGNISPPPAGAVFSTTGVYKDVQWNDSPYPTANWAWLEYNHSGMMIDLWYRFQFNLAPSVNPAAFSLQMDFMADNAVSEVFVNGVAQSSKTTGLPQNTTANPANTAYENPYGYLGFRQWRRAQTTLNHDWQPGLNTMIVQVKSGQPLEGFLAAIRPNTPLCVAGSTSGEVAPVPTLNQWALVGLALVTCITATLSLRRA